ncbi:MAG: SufD family Fe-S cluster assembly protein [Coriobacteriales bacterium]|nr:SufD family Fe-S cluster assembly protein [Coriobacteriales bacterium]
MANNDVKLEKVDQDLLDAIADLHALPTGAYNIRKDGELLVRNSDANINIIANSKGKPGIEIHIADGTKNEVCHIPVIITKTGITDVVSNDFYIGKNCNITIIAGCGIHNSGSQKSQHDGVHTFYVGEGSSVKYIEKHYGSKGDGATGEVVMNPQTRVELSCGASLSMEMIQISGIDNTVRDTSAVLAAESKLVIEERLLTEGQQIAKSNVEINLDGKDSSVQIISRSVAKDNSIQIFQPLVVGKSECRGHVQCDSILMGQASVKSVPAIEAQNPDAQLFHEAAIGKIAGDQIIKLMTLGLSEQEAEEQILKDFLS